MKFRIKTLAALIVVMLSCCALAACGSDDNDDDEPTVPTVTEADIIGHWSSTDDAFDVDVITFNADGTGCQKFGSYNSIAQFDFHWSLSGTNLNIDGEVAAVNIAGPRASLTYGTSTYTKGARLYPNDSPTMGFWGLREIVDKDYLLSFQYDEEGRITGSVNTSTKSRYCFEYSENKIISYRFREDGSNSVKLTYNLTDGLITSYTRQNKYGVFQEYTITYDRNNRISNIKLQEISHDDDGLEMRLEIQDFWYYKWSSSGDLYEIEYRYYDETGEPAKISNYRYEYLPSIAQIPCLKIAGLHGVPLLSSLDTKYNGSGLWPELIAQGYFGNSMPKHNLKSMCCYYSDSELTWRYDWSYSFDSRGRITKMTEDRLYIESGETYQDEYIFRWN